MRRVYHPSASAEGFCSREKRFRSAVAFVTMLVMVAMLGPARTPRGCSPGGGLSLLPVAGNGFSQGSEGAPQLEEARTWYVVAYRRAPGPDDLLRLRQAGASGGWVLPHLRMVAVHVRNADRERLAALDGVASVYPGETAAFATDQASGALASREPALPSTGETGPVLPELTGSAGAGPGGPGEAGPAVALIDTGLDQSHPAFDHVVVRANLRFELNNAPTDIRELSATPEQVCADPVGHGTAVAGAILAGWEAGGRHIQATGNTPTSAAPEVVRSRPALVSISAGNSRAWIVEVLAAMDYLAEKGRSLGVRVINNSWAVGGPWDPHHPVNLATYRLARSGFVVVFSARTPRGEFNAFARAPWVIAVEGKPAQGAADTRPPVEAAAVPHHQTQSPRSQLILVGPRSVYGVPLAGTADLTVLTGTSAAAGYASGWLLRVTASAGQ